MSLVSWFSRPQNHSPSPWSIPSRQPRRQPTHSRPSLEYLEERTLLDASSGLIGGATGNLALNNNFNLASNGVILPTPGFSTGASVANGANGAHSLDFSGLASGGTGAQAASSAFLAQGSTNAQFRIFAVNSQGPDYSLFQQTLLNFQTQAYGFGSGTAPNAPWRPNAYNLGLGNRQFNYSSQSDFGFQPVPPWTVPVAQTRPESQLDDEDGTAAEEPEQALAQKSTPEQEQTQQKRMDDLMDRIERAEKQLEKPASEKEHLADEALMQRDSSIPDAVWLSALAPAPMAALVAGLPGLAAASEGGDGGEVGAEGSE